MQQMQSVTVIQYIILLCSKRHTVSMSDTSRVGRIFFDDHSAMLLIELASQNSKSVPAVVWLLISFKQNNAISIL